MSRLIDDAIAFGVQIPSSSKAFFADELSARHRMDRCIGEHGPVFVIHNVADYFFSLPQHEITWRSGLPNIAPPFAEWWMEFRLPPERLSPRANILAVGTSHHAIEIPSSQAEYVFRDRLGAFVRESRDATVDDAIMRKSNGERLRWVVKTLTFLRIAGERQLVGPFNDTEICIGERGSILLTPFFVSNPDDVEIDRYVVFQLVSFLGVCLLNCQNVQSVNHVPDERTERRFTQRYEKPMVRWHTLVIEPMKRLLAESGSGSVGIQKALHICRGHFKDYRAAGLFGKLKGMYWWDAHVRGTVAAGVAPKDYAVKAPSREPVA